MKHPITPVPVEQHNRKMEGYNQSLEEKQQWEERLVGRAKTPCDFGVCMESGVIGNGGSRQLAAPSLDEIEGSYDGDESFD